MSITVVWDNAEKTIVRFDYTPKWTWDEFYIAVQEANTMMDSVDKTCVSIVDMSRTSFLPPGAGIHIRNIIRQSMSHNNSGVVVFLNADTIVKMMIDGLRQNYPDIKDFSNFIYSKNLEDARQLAEEQVNRLHARV